MSFNVIPGAGGGSGGAGGGAAPGALNPADLAQAASNMLTAFGGAITGYFQASANEKQELTQLIVDIQQYNLQYQSGDLTKKGAQRFIQEAIQDATDTMQTYAQIREAQADAAMNAALQILEQAIQTTLSAAFAGFAFAL